MPIFADPPVVTESKPAYNVGFTPFAREKLLLLTSDGGGFPKDTKSRVYIMGGTHPVTGKRVRHESRGTIMAVFIDYTKRDECVRLWVQWKDGRRHLVHRKV